MALATVRPAVAADVDEIVRIQAETWRVGYAAIVPPAALERLTSEPARQAWAAAVEAGEGFHVLVATEGDWTVGFCAAASHRGPEAAVAEIGTLLVEPRWGRRGHGGRLLAAAAGLLHAAGTERGHAWLPEADVASRRFYARAGWEPDGAARTLDTGDGTLREIRVTGSLHVEASSAVSRAAGCTMISESPRRRPVTPARAGTPGPPSGRDGHVPPAPPSALPA